MSCEIKSTNARSQLFPMMSSKYIDFIVKVGVGRDTMDRFLLYITHKYNNNDNEIVSRCYKINILKDITNDSWESLTWNFNLSCHCWMISKVQPSCTLIVLSSNVFYLCFHFILIHHLKDKRYNHLNVEQISLKKSIQNN